MVGDNRAIELPDFKRVRVASGRFRGLPLHSYSPAWRTVNPGRPDRPRFVAFRFDGRHRC